jgi:hypothetical protein
VSDTAFVACQAPAFEQLYQEARPLGLEGRSKMRKSELERAVERKKR